MKRRKKESDEEKEERRTLKISKHQVKLNEDFKKKKQAKQDDREWMRPLLTTHSMRYLKPTSCGFSCGTTKQTETLSYSTVKGRPAILSCLYVLTSQKRKSKRKGNQAEPTHSNANDWPNISGRQDRQDQFWTFFFLFSFWSTWKCWFLLAPAFTKYQVFFFLCNRKAKAKSISRRWRWRWKVFGKEERENRARLDRNLTQTCVCASKRPPSLLFFTNQLWPLLILYIF